MDKGSLTLVEVPKKVKELAKLYYKPVKHAETKPKLINEQNEVNHYVFAWKN